MWRKRHTSCRSSQPTQVHQCRVMIDNGGVGYREKLGGGDSEMPFSDDLRDRLRDEAGRVGGIRRFARLHNFDRSHLEKFLNGRGLSLKNIDRLVAVVGLGPLEEPEELAPHPRGDQGDQINDRTFKAEKPYVDDGEPF
jgi:hypothetical protein